MTKIRRCGLAAAMLLALTFAAATQAQATERFRVSLSGTWKTQAHETDTTCYRFAGPESSDTIRFTGEFDGVETASFSTVRTGTALARVERGRLEVVGTGPPLRLRIPLDRQSTAGRPCKADDGEGPPDCGKRDLRLGGGVFNRGAALTFGWVKQFTDPIGGQGYSYYTPADPYARCQLVELQDGLPAATRGDRRGNGLRGGAGEPQGAHGPAPQDTRAARLGRGASAEGHARRRRAG